MKRGLIILSLVISGVAQGQTLKETLYGGKLKNEAGSVIRKGDDLSTKIDTTNKARIKDSIQLKNGIEPTNSKATKEVKEINDATKDSKDITASSLTTDGVPNNKIGIENAIVKDNTVLWNEYITSVSNTLKTETLPSKKIKKGTYYISLSYAIGLDGQSTINNVIVTPENGFLQQQIKDRIGIDAPRLNPILSSTGAPRKVNKNYNFTLVKD